MTFETESQKREIQRWSRLAIQLIGAADSGTFDHLTVPVVVQELQENRAFEFLTRELPSSVWDISRLTDVDRHKLSRHFHMMATSYEPKQFHVTSHGLLLLSAYVLHLIDLAHASIPQ